jgi:hypothetical protein
VYITGSSRIDPSNSDFITIKYNSNGEEQWAAHYCESPNHNDWAYHIDIDNEGNVYVGGNSHIDVYDSDWNVIKYAPDGHVLWVATYNGPTGGSGILNDMELDDEGNSYICGMKDEMGSDYWDYHTIKYNEFGIRQWVALYGSPNETDIACDLAVDNEGSVYVTGECETPAYRDYVTVKYNTEGVQLWVKRSDYKNSDDHPAHIVVDDDGFIYITGSGQTLHEENYFTVKYNQEGGQIEDGEQLREPSDALSPILSPNPFNPSTVISYQLSVVSFVNLAVYDVSGRLVAELVNGWRDMGAHEVTFDGSGLASGVYIYRLEASGSGKTPTIVRGKMVLVK